MSVTGFDHIALPTEDAERLVAFYLKLGFGTEYLEEWRAGTFPLFSITFGPNKINVHPEQLIPLRGRPEYLRGPTAEAGCGDVCFVWAGGTDAVLDLLERRGIGVVDGPVVRRGGRGEDGVSVYVRDPDENLVEFISYEPEDLEQYRHRGGVVAPPSSA